MLVSKMASDALVLKRQAIGIHNIDPISITQALLLKLYFWQEYI